ncbi:MAG: class I SAM-dependent methyltransferase [Allosphingosinicella sp.]
MTPEERLYEGRKLAEAYPGLETMANEHFTTHAMGVEGVAETMTILSRITDLPAGNNKVALVGCGPLPYSLKTLVGMGYDVVGVEPVPGFVESARNFLGDSGARVLQGSAENLPFEDNSMAAVVLETVLEHVDSPSKTLNEAYRVLAPGGVAFIETLNRHRFSIRGFNGEYNLPFFNYYPKTLKEAFVHHHLHYNPKLANYSTRPAVHWFSYADLCAAGREAGFYRFYPRFDGMRPGDPSVSRGKMRQLMLKKIRFSPFFRFLALLQYGSSVFMLKRPD